MRRWRNIRRWQMTGTPEKPRQNRKQSEYLYCQQYWYLMQIRLAERPTKTLPDSSRTSPSGHGRGWAFGASFSPPIHRWMAPSPAWCRSLTQSISQPSNIWPRHDFNDVCDGRSFTEDYPEWDENTMQNWQEYANSEMSESSEPYVFPLYNLCSKAPVPTR